MTLFFLILMAICSFWAGYLLGGIKEGEKHLKDLELLNNIIRKLEKGFEPMSPKDLPNFYEE